MRGLSVNSAAGSLVLRVCPLPATPRAGGQRTGRRGCLPLDERTPLVSRGLFTARGDDRGLRAIAAARLSDVLRQGGRDVDRAPSTPSRKKDFQPEGRRKRGGGLPEAVERAACCGGTRAGSRDQVRVPTTDVDEGQHPTKPVASRQALGSPSRWARASSTPRSGRRRRRRVEAATRPCRLVHPGSGGLRHGGLATDARVRPPRHTPNNIARESPSRWKSTRAACPCCREGSGRALPPRALATAAQSSRSGVWRRWTSIALLRPAELGRDTAARTEVSLFFLTRGALPQGRSSTHRAARLSLMCPELDCLRNAC